jgi:ABC-type Zn uptake system ZnuABC Zn-binding protein ZnuA
MEPLTVSIKANLDSAKAAIEAAKEVRTINVKNKDIPVHVFVDAKKTTVQQLMTELKELHPELFDVYTEKGRQFVNNFHKYLDIEKEQIVQAFNYGGSIDLVIGSDYYKLIYGE